MKVALIITVIWALASLFIAVNQQKGTFWQKTKNFFEALVPPFYILKKLVIFIYFFIAHIVVKLKTKKNGSNPA